MDVPMLHEQTVEDITACTYSYLLHLVPEDLEGPDASVVMINDLKYFFKYCPPVHAVIQAFWLGVSTGLPEPRNTALAVKLIHLLEQSMPRTEEDHFTWPELYDLWIKPCFNQVSNA